MGDAKRSHGQTNGIDPRMGRNKQWLFQRQRSRIEQPLGHSRATQPLFTQLERKRPAIHGNGLVVGAEQVIHGPDMVFVAVGQKNGMWGAKTVKQR